MELLGAEDLAELVPAGRVRATGVHRHIYLAAVVRRSNPLPRNHHKNAEVLEADEDRSSRSTRL